jgi:hypothetical protein
MGCRAADAAALSRERRVKQVDLYKYRVWWQFRYFFSLPDELPGFDPSEPELPDIELPVSPEPLEAESAVPLPSFEALPPEPLRA